MKNKLRGWQNVYAFTFMQCIKSKPLMITTVIMFLVALFGLPVSSLIMESMSSKDAEKMSFETVYVIDELGMGLTSFSELGKDERYEDITYQLETRSRKEMDKELKKAGEKEKAIALVIQMGEETGGYLLEFLYGEGTQVSKDHVDTFAKDVATYFEEHIVDVLPIEKEQIEELQLPVKTKVIKTDADGKVEKKEKGTSVSQLEYWVIYALLFVFLMSVTFSGDGVSGAIITEKSSKVIEYLLISTSPMALMFGKILGRLSIVLMQFALMGTGFFFSASIMAGKSFVQLADMDAEVAEKVMDAVEMVISKDTFHGFSVGSLLLGILVFLGGFLLYNMVAGLMGATVSKIEDAAEASKLFVFSLLIGAYLALAVIMFGLEGGGNAALEKFALLCPLSAPFITPAYLWLGKTSVLIGLGALVLELVCCGFLLVFVSRVYENMIFHNGEILKIKDIVKLFRGDRGNVAKGGSHEG